jgi:hypothetical protein
MTQIPDELQQSPAGQPLSQSISLTEEGQYLGVPVADFLDLDQIHLDIFIKSPNGKFLLLAPAGEPGIGSRVQNYWSRGLQFLYVSRDAYGRQLTSIELFKNLLPASTKGSSTLKTARAIRDVSKVIEGLRSMEQVSQDAWDSVSNSLALLHRHWAEGPWANPTTALQNATLLDHSLSVLVMALMIGRHQGFESEENTIRLGLAAAFHDIGLLDLGFSIPNEENPSLLTNGTQKSRFLDHPSVGANWIRDRFRGEEIVAQAVALHHWRRDDSGFYQKGAQPVLDAPRLAEIIGMAECASNDLLKSPFGTSAIHADPWARRLVSRIEDQFSGQAIDGFLQAFAPRSQQD